MSWNCNTTGKMRWEKQYVEHACFWSELLARIKTSKQSAHLSSLKLAVKKKEMSLATKEMSFFTRDDETTLRLKKCNEKKQRARKKLSDSSLHEGDDAPSRHPSHGLKEEEFNLQLASYEKRLTLLEAVYRNLLRYDMYVYKTKEPYITHKRALYHP